MGEIAVKGPKEVTNFDMPICYDPHKVLSMGQKMAKALKQVLTQNRWTVKIGSSEHLRFEAWQTLGSFFGYVPTVLKVEEIREGNKVMGYLCVGGVKRLRDGVIVSEAEATCMRDEPNWKNKPLFQLRSMAQTRACAKALRLCFSWIVTLAGYDPTPAEEVEETSAPSKETSSLQEKESGVTKSQLKMMGVLFDKLGITDREERLANVSNIIEREINSANDLTKEEANKVIESLKSAVSFEEAMEQKND